MNDNGGLTRKKPRTLWYILAVTGAVVVVLIIILVSIITGDEAQRKAGEMAEIVVPESEFIYNPDEEYGGALKFSSELEETFFGELSDKAYTEITKRISAWFAIEYPKYESFGLVKDSYKKEEKEDKIKTQVKAVSNFGTIAGFEMIDELSDGFTVKTTLKILTTRGEEAFKTEIKWEDLDV